MKHKIGYISAGIIAISMLTMSVGCSNDSKQVDAELNSSDVTTNDNESKQSSDHSSQTGQNIVPAFNDKNPPLLDIKDGSSKPFIIALSASSSFMDATVTGKFIVEKNCLVLLTASNKRYTPVFQPYHQVEYRLSTPSYLTIRGERLDLDKWTLISGGALDFYDTIFLDKGLMDDLPPEECPKVGYPLGYFEGN